MTFRTLSAASLLIAAVCGSPAQADLLGKAGGALRDVGSTVSNTVDRVTSRDRSTDVGARASVSRGSAGQGALGRTSARVGAGVNAAGLAKVGVCVEANTSGGCGAAAATQAKPTARHSNAPRAAAGHTMTKQANATNDRLLNTRDYDLDGMIAYGSNGVPLGAIKRVTSQGANPTIVVQIDSRRNVQLRNAIATIRSDGVWLSVPAETIKDRASGRMTRLALR